MNRSEELCKLLGVEPKKEIALHCGTNCNRYNCIMDRDCEHYKPIGAYPDLTKPSNFIKLLEMKIFKTQTLLKNIMGWSFSLTRDIDDINSFVEAIENYIYELKEQDYYEIIEEIQHQAQATKWDY